MKYFFIVFSILLMSSTFSSAETVTRIAAVVNDEIITTFQLEKEVEKALHDPRVTPPSTEEERESFRRQVLDRLIEEALVRQRVEELGLQVGDEEVDEAIADVERSNRISREKLIEALAEQGLEFKEYRENLRQQILRFKLLGREVNAKVDVTIPEIEQYYREHLEDFRARPFVRLSRLSFYIPSKASAVQKGVLFDKAIKARQRLLSGENFDSVLAALAGEGNADGGDMGTFGEGELIPRFEEAIASLNEGGITDVVETESGYHVLVVTEKSAGKVKDLDAVRDRIETILRERKTEERFKEWSKGLREKAFIDIRL